MEFAVSISECERSFLAGFLEGESTLVIRELNGGQSFSCGLDLKQRDDEQDTLEWLVALTGVGDLIRVPARATSKPQIAWLIRTQADCQELLDIIEPCGFHGRRAVELEFWRRAIRAWTQAAGAARRAELRRLRDDLAAARRFGGGAASARPFASRRAFLGYISGFVCAEGCFGFSNGRPRFAVHLRQDDEPLLRLLADETGLGHVTRHRPAPPLNPSATWTITRRTELVRLRDLLWSGGIAGRKLAQMELWGTAVDELCDAKRVGRRPRRDVLEAARARLAAARVYRPPERPDLLQLPRRDVRATSLEALRTWSRECTGALSCTAYSRWRAERREHPTRNTIVRHFGGWHAALAAAGLGDRVARAPRRYGGAARREARRRAQRERVLDAVRRFERERGRLPRAMEFFRWRIERAADAPTQGTVYRLFPGGWDEVLAGVRHPGGGDAVPPGGRQVAGAVV